MRLVLVTLLAAGCHGTGATPPLPSGIVLHVELMAPVQTTNVAVASAAMHLGSVTAVSDRDAAAGRAATRDIDLMLGAASDVALPDAPPGLYSAVDAELGSAGQLGLDVQGVWRTLRVHATVASVPFDVGCASPVRVDPGVAARLSLRADPADWFAGLDLSSATGDTDDNGIVLSEDDNRPLLQALIANLTRSFALDCAPASGS